MFRIAITPAWHVRKAGEPPSGDTVQLLQLLAHIETSGSIAAAARGLGLSYRHAWGLLREAEALFGSELLEKQPGRGTRLSALARLLLLADERVKARLTPTLESLASELESELRKFLSSERRPLRLFASHGFAVETFVDALSKADVPVELSYRNSTEALAALSRRECDLAGFHVPIGEFETAAMRRYRQWLDPSRHSLIHLATRRQGLLVARGNPKRIAGLPDLLRDGVRFVNRQAGSGTRMLLELMLDAAGLDAAHINGFDSSEFTHAAVAAYVASGMADAGFGIEAAARRFALDFIPLVEERYFFAVESAMLDSPQCVQALDILRDASFRARVGTLPGYGSASTGQVQGVDEAFGSSSG